jgi:hypothetical protein
VAALVVVTGKGSPAVGVRWERNLQETLFPPIELVEARERCAEGVRGSSRYSEGQIYGEKMKVW